MNLIWRGEELEVALQEAFQDVALRLDRKIHEAISDDRWVWPVGETPRDIIDTGALRASQQAALFRGPGLAEYANNIAYALTVHEGYTTHGGFTAPARPWMTKTLEEFGFPEELVDAFEART